MLNKFFAKIRHYNFKDLKTQTENFRYVLTKEVGLDYIFPLL